MTAYEHAGRNITRHSALRIAVVQGTLPDDWRDIHGRIDGRALASHGTCLNLFAGAAAFATVVAAGWALAEAAAAVFPSMSAYLLCCLILLPSLLAGAAAGQFAGNLYLRCALGLDDETRRGFATRLSLARCPAEWPTAFKRWLFTGDWLGSPSYDLRVPYARIFIEGSASLTCREEDALWREIHCGVSGDALWEAGANFREISYPEKLPAWAAEVENGDGFANLQSRIGRVEASDWVMHLWRRACRQWPALGANDYPGEARRECFEMHSLTLAGGRRALVVVLRPTSFVMELELENQDSVAA